MIHCRSKSIFIAAGSVLMGMLGCMTASAQGRAVQGRAPEVTSPEVLPDGRIVFRISAPKAESVGLEASDIPSLARSGPQFVKKESGVWEATIAPVEPCAYRYVFMINGVSVMDLKPPWLAAGSEDFPASTTKSTVELFKKH